MRLVLTRLRDNNLYVRCKKYELLKKETEFLGLVAGRSGIKIGCDGKKAASDGPTLKM